MTMHLCIIGNRPVFFSLLLQLTFPGSPDEHLGALVRMQEEKRKLARGSKKPQKPASNISQLVGIQRGKVVFLILQCELRCVNPCAQKSEEPLVWRLNCFVKAFYLHNIYVFTVFMLMWDCNNTLAFKRDSLTTIMKSFHE